jgi:hypothetical protein
MIPALRRFQSSWNGQRIHAKKPDSAIIFAHYLKTWKTLRNPSDSPHERPAFMKLELSFRRWSTNLFHEYRQTRRFEGVRFSPNSPTLAPRGSELTLMIQFREYPWILVKNVTLGMSEWTRVLRISRNGHIEAVSWNYPLSPINRDVHTVKKFSPLHRFLRTFACIFAERLFATKSPKLQDFLDFLRYCFLCSSIIIFYFFNIRIPKFLFRVFCFINVILGFALVLLQIRWPVLKAPQDPWHPKSWLRLVFCLPKKF